MNYTAAQLVFRKLAGKDGSPADIEQQFIDVVKKFNDAALNEMEIAAGYRARREAAAKMMQNDFECRVTNEEKNIFRLSNRTMGLIRSGIAFVTARTQEDIFGSSPWFSVSPEGKDDGELAERIQKHADVKLRMAGFEDVGERAVERVFNFGEAIYRTGWRVDVNRYHRLAPVLCDAKGEPVLKPDGDYIYEQDIVPEEMPPAEEGVAEVAAEAPEARLVVPGTNIVFDPKQHQWCELLIEEKDVVYNGLDPVMIEWENFRCAPSYPTVEHAPFRGHVYEQRLSDLVSTLEERHGVPLDKFDADTLELLQLLQTNSATAKDEKREKQGAAQQGDEKNPIIKCLDFEVEWDPNGNGVTSWFFGTLLIDHDRLFFYDYLANLLDGGGSLYEPVAAYCLPNSWAGRGWWELYEEFGNNADRLWNTLIHRDSMIANPPAGVNWDAIEESADSVRARLGQPGFHVTLKADKRMADFIDFAAFPNMDRSSWELLQFFMKLYQLETGVTSSAQGGLGDMPATNTATGIQSVLASGSTLHRRPAKEIRDALQKVIEKSLVVLYSNHDKAESVRIGDGQNAVLVTLTPDDVRDLKLNVRILMTRVAQREMAERAKGALEAFMQYIALPEVEKEGARSLFLQLLKANGVQDAENILRKPLPPGPPDITESIKIGYPDLPRKSKVQALQKLGFDVTLEEIEAEEEYAKNAREAAAKQPPKKAA